MTRPEELPTMTDLAHPAAPSPTTTAEPVAPPLAVPTPREIGGRQGPDPTRYGDWELKGRCIDF